MLALNVTVVLDDNATSYVKFDSVGRIFAFWPFSGSGSGSGKGELEDSPTNKERGKQKCDDCCTVKNMNGEEETTQVCSCPGFLGAKDCSPSACSNPECSNSATN